MLPRFTLQRLMVAVAFIALSMAALRVHPALGSFVSGVSFMALLRTARITDRLQATNSDVRAIFVVRTLLVSWLLAAFILTASLLPSLCILPAVIAFGKFDAETIVTILVLAITGVPIASLLRRKLW